MFKSEQKEEQPDDDGVSSWKEQQQEGSLHCRTSIIILPVNIAKRNGVVWTPVDSDEPNYVGVTGVQVDILGQANVCNIKGGHNLQVQDSKLRRFL